MLRRSNLSIRPRLPKERPGGRASRGQQLGIRADGEPSLGSSEQRGITSRYANAPDLALISAADRIALRLAQALAGKTSQKVVIQHRCQLAGAMLFLPKPVSGDMLVKAIWSVMPDLVKSRTPGRTLP
jgi:hypothetical protein